MLSQRTANRPVSGEQNDLEGSKLTCITDMFLGSNPLSDLKSKRRLSNSNIGIIRESMDCGEERSVQMHGPFYTLYREREKEKESHMSH